MERIHSIVDVRGISGVKRPAGPMRKSMKRIGMKITIFGMKEKFKTFLPRWPIIRGKNDLTEKPNKSGSGSLMSDCWPNKMSDRLSIWCCGRLTKVRLRFDKSGWRHSPVSEVNDSRFGSAWNLKRCDHYRRGGSAQSHFIWRIRTSFWSETVII
jgi:hypothetical protein